MERNGKGRCAGADLNTAVGKDRRHTLAHNDAAIGLKRIHILSGIDSRDDAADSKGIEHSFGNLNDVVWPDFT